MKFHTAKIPNCAKRPRLRLWTPKKTDECGPCAHVDLVLPGDCTLTLAARKPSRRGNLKHTISATYYEAYETLETLTQQAYRRYQRADARARRATR